MKFNLVEGGRVVAVCEVTELLALHKNTISREIELMHMIRKGQCEIDGADAMSIADQFSAMAPVVRPV